MVKTNLPSWTIKFLYCIVPYYKPDHCDANYFLNLCHLVGLLLRKLFLVPIIRDVFLEVSISILSFIYSVNNNHTVHTFPLTLSSKVINLPICDSCPWC